MNNASGMSDSGRILQQCIVCDEGTAAWSMQKEEFPYGIGEAVVTLTAEVPVWSCADCGMEYTADGAEASRHEAVCRHLDRLTPAQIRQIRDRAGMTQARFAEVLNVGLASLKRWETGAVIPNASTNALLKEFAFKPRGMALPTPRFQTELSMDKITAAHRWALRPMSERQMPLAA